MKKPYFNSLGELEDMSREAERELLKADTGKGTGQSDSPCVSISEELDFVSPEEWFEPLDFSEGHVETECQKVAWGVYLATRSGCGEEALAYLTINGSQPFLELCREQIFPRFDRAKSPQLPQGPFSGLFLSEGGDCCDDQD